MSLKTTLSKHLSPELLQQVEDALGDDFDFDLVPRSRLNKVIGQRNDARAALAAATQAASSSTNDDDDDDDDDDDEGSAGKKGTQTTGITKKELDRLTKQMQKEKDDAVKSVKIQYAALDKLREAGALDAELCYGLLDKEKITFNDKNEVTGIDDQVVELQKGKPFLFGSEENVPGGTGKYGRGPGSSLEQAISGVFANYGIQPIENNK